MEIADWKKLFAPHILSDFDKEVKRLIDKSEK